jgi:hypothetical protein
VFTINRQTLEALFAPKFGDNGIVANVNENHNSVWEDRLKVKRKVFTWSKILTWNNALT